MKTKITILSMLMLFSIVTFGRTQKRGSKSLDFSKFKHGKLIENKLKSTKITKQRLDSVIGDRDFKYYLIYDYQQRVVEITGTGVEETEGGEYLFTQKTELEYDAKGNIIKETEYIGEENNWTDWVKDNLYEYKYNNNGNKIGEIDSEWDDDKNMWVVEEKYEYEYNQDGKLTTEIYSNNRNNDTLDFNSKYEFEYNIDGNIIKQIISDWDTQNKKWEYTFKSEAQYDEQGNIIEEVLYHYYDVDWSQSSKNKTEYEYDADKKIVSKIVYYWQSSDWAKNNKNVYEYDEHNRETSDEYYDWSSEENKFVLRHKKRADWDQYGNILLEEYLNWYSSSGLINDGDRSTYTYDYSYTKNDIIFPLDSEFDIEHMMTKMIGYDWNESLENWEKGEELILYYASVETGGVGINKTENEHLITVYPNPVTDILCIESPASIKEASIYDIHGIIVFQQSNINNAINVSSLKHGVYFVKIVTAEGEAIRKIVKK